MKIKCDCVCRSVLLSIHYYTHKGLILLLLLSTSRYCSLNTLFSNLLKIPLCFLSKYLTLFLQSLSCPSLWSDKQSLSICCVLRNEAKSLYYLLWSGPLLSSCTTCVYYLIWHLPCFCTFIFGFFY